jgi:hypothetical protein
MTWSQARECDQNIRADIEAYGRQCAEHVAGPLREEVKALRRLLFHVYTGPVLGYTDDGELQDGTAHTAIDFIRYTPEQIAQAISRRDGKGGRSGELRGRIAELEQHASKLQESHDTYRQRLWELAEEHRKLRAESTIEWEPGRSYTAAELLRRAIRGIRGRNGRSICPAVENLFGCGNTVARYLCRWAGRDPDTGREIAARKGEGSE